MTLGTKLTAVDIEALTRAYETASAESTEYREHLAHIEAQSGWAEAAQSASYHLQVKNLQLKCWECPPSSCRNSIDVIDNTMYGSRTKEVKLRRRLLGLGLSRKPRSSEWKVHVVMRALSSPRRSLPTPCPEKKSPAARRGVRGSSSSHLPRRECVIIIARNSAVRKNSWGPHNASINRRRA